MVELSAHLWSFLWPVAHRWRKSRDMFESWTRLHFTSQRSWERQRNISRLSRVINESSDKLGSLAFVRQNNWCHERKFVSSKETGLRESTAHGHALVVIKRFGWFFTSLHLDKQMNYLTIWLRLIVIIDDDITYLLNGRSVSFSRKIRRRHLWTKVRPPTKTSVLSVILNCILWWVGWLFGWFLDLMVYQHL